MELLAPNNSKIFPRASPSTHGTEWQSKILCYVWGNQGKERLTEPRAQVPAPTPLAERRQLLTYPRGSGRLRSCCSDLPQASPLQSNWKHGVTVCLETGEHPSFFWGRGGGGPQGRKAEENEQCCLPREKVLGKMSSIPGDQVGKHYPGRSVSFGKEPGGTGARSKGGGLENTAAILFQASLWGTRGRCCGGREPQQQELKHYLPCNVHTEWKPSLHAARTLLQFGLPRSQRLESTAAPCRAGKKRTRGLFIPNKLNILPRLQEDFIFSALLLSYF